MADTVSVGRSVKSLRTNPTFPAISAVRMLVDGDTIYEASTGQDGYELEISSPWASQSQADWLLTKMAGIEYSPYEAEVGQLGPEVELGDYANIRGVFGGVLSENIDFGKNYTASFGSPADEEIDHEYKFESKTERKISQKVSKKSPKKNTEFGWNLQDDEWKIYNQDGDIFKVSATGAKLKGEFEIIGGSISIQNSSGTQVFQVDDEGNLYATSGTFAGEVHAGKIQYGGTYGTMRGDGLTSGSVGYSKTTSTVQTNLDQVWTNQSDIAAINSLFVGTLNVNNLKIGSNFELGALTVSTKTVGGQSNVLYGF